LIVPADAARLAAYGNAHSIEVNMQPASMAFKPQRSQEWTPERLERLDTADLQQLRENAASLGAEALVAMCDAALEGRPKARLKRGAGGGVPKRARKLISRTKAFQARGVYLPDHDSSWSGVRKSDGAVVMSLWAPAIARAKGGCRHLLWGPNVDGLRPWSDTLAGKERLAHCKLALERGAAEGLLVYGENFDGEAAEHNARSVHGVDPEHVVMFKVERRGEEYWAVWGAKAEARPL
jgi:hypothetical protein